MRVLISTIVDNINFGTYLQAVATSHLFTKAGCDVQILDYNRPYLSGDYYASNYLKDTKKNWILRYMYYFGYKALNRYMTNNVKKFLKKNAKLSPTFHSYDEVVEYIENTKFDILISGSDQIWNTIHNFGIDKTFFWANLNLPKASFSSSIGLKEYPKEHRDIIRAYLSDYKYISVREKDGVEILEQMGLDNIHHIIDPTLILNDSEWRKIIRKSKDLPKEKYLLIYSVEIGRNNKVIDIAKRIAKERGLKTVLVCPTLKFKLNVDVDYLFSLANVDTFVSLIDNADYIVASSFHGTAFAINFKKQFVTISPERFNSRVLSLLNLFNLSDHYIQDTYSILKDIDYSEQIEAKLEEERFKALSAISSIIDNK